MIRFILNNEHQTIDADEDTPLVWIIREHLGLTGTKYSCGIGTCGACTVHLNGKAARACAIPISTLKPEDHITTIEGLSAKGTHPVQQAWINNHVPQCGYCQPGQIMAASALLNANPKPSNAEINQAMAGNICRCGTYPRIRKAIEEAIELSQ